MKKIIIVCSVTITVVLVSCQKDYVCFCTNANSGVTKYKERYVGTGFAKKKADKTCKANMEVLTDSLTNCRIE